MLLQRLRCCSGAARTLGRTCVQQAARQTCGKPLTTRRLLSTAAEATEAEATGLRWLLKEGQVDSGFWQGTALLGAVIGGVTVSSEEQRKAAVVSLLGFYRSCGLKEEYISDKVLIVDYVRKNSAAACNVLMASPVFYFMFSRIYGYSLAVCAVRSITGSARIVPFMFSFYAFFAIVCPFATAELMKLGQKYEEASTNAAIGVMLSGFVFIEALVELRGCGVTFSQMTVGSFIMFIPALVGRLTTGVLTQQQKTGAEEASAPFLPASWNDADAPTWQQHTYMLFDRLALDNEFLVTCAGTSVFQHVLNSITFMLLTNGKSATVWSITKFMIGGPNGTVLSGASQFGKTFLMRLGFAWAWNWCTSQNLPMPVFDPFLAEERA